MKSRSRAGSQSRPVFEPVVVAVPPGSDQLLVTAHQLPVSASQLPVATDQLPVPVLQLSVAADQLPVSAVQLPVAAPEPLLHFRKPDVISDVNEDVAEPLRPAPRTDRHRQRTSRPPHSTSEEHPAVPASPLPPAITAREGSVSDTSSSTSSGSNSEDDESSGSGDSDEYLLAKTETQNRDRSERRHVSSGLGENLPPVGRMEGTVRAPVRTVGLYIFTLIDY